MKSQSSTHAAQDVISQLADDILFMPVQESYDEATDQLIHQRQYALVAILSRAKPLSGEGYFNVDRSMIMSVIGAAITYIIVLLQFNLTEKTNIEPKINSSCNATNFTI